MKNQKYSKAQVDEIVLREYLTVSFREISRLFGLSEWSVRKSIERLKLKREKNIMPHGDKSANWKGGVTYNSYKYKKIHMKKRPEHFKARNALYYAVKKGKLIRGACVICGTTKKIEGHHEDYSKPLEVTWLCQKDHRALHAGKVSLANLTTKQK